MLYSAQKSALFLQFSNLIRRWCWIKAKVTGYNWCDDNQQDGHANHYANFFLWLWLYCAHIIVSVICGRTHESNLKRRLSHYKWKREKENMFWFSWNVYSNEKKIFIKIVWMVNITISNTQCIIHTHNGNHRMIGSVV